MLETSGVMGLYNLVQNGSMTTRGRGRAAAEEGEATAAEEDFVATKALGQGRWHYCSMPVPWLLQQQPLLPLLEGVWKEDVGVVAAAAAAAVI
jgi:hypothetical protein